MLTDSLVYLVDDDEMALWTAQQLLEGIGANFRAFTSASEFLRTYRPSACECLVCDLRMPELGGLEVQSRLLAQGASLPIIFLSGYPEVSSAVEAIKRGAFDFLEKPVNGHQLIDKVQSALMRSRELHSLRLARAAREARLALLTNKEREVAEQIAAGSSNREIAQRLELSVRTVENHRSHLMRKLHLNSVADLIRMLL